MRCSAKFGLTRWRHHCRKCGQVVCKECLPFERALGLECGGGFAGDGGRLGSIAEAVPVCADCNAVRRRRHTRTRAPAAPRTRTVSSR